MATRDPVVVSKVLQKNAQERPDKTAYVRAETDTSLTYQEIYEFSNRIGHALKSLGVEREDRVLSMNPTSLETLATWYGCTTFGAIEVPINTALKGNLLSYMVNDCSAETMIINQSYVERLERVEDDLKFLETVVVIDAETPLETSLDLRVLSWEDFLNDQPTALPKLDRDLRKRDPCCIIYTSGTTGRSKGVVWSYAQASEASKNDSPDPGPEDTFYTPYPLYHASGKVFNFGMAQVGGTAVMRNGFSTSKFWEEVRQYDCTQSLLMSSVVQFIWKQPEQPDDADNPLEKVLMVPILPEYEEFRERFDVKLYSCWNQTETCVPIWLNDEDLEDPSACGKLRDGFEARIVDDNDEEVPTGEVGELVLRADDPWVLMTEYWNKPNKTVDSWRNLWLHTGDLMRRDEEGYFYYVDRKDDFIRRRGENISSLELDAEINSHPSVFECATVAVPSEYSEDEVKAYIVVKEDEELDPEKLIEFLEPRIPYYMIPRYVEFVEELPRTPSQKIQKYKLRQEGITDATWDREEAGVEIEHE